LRARDVSAIVKNIPKVGLFMNKLSIEPSTDSLKRVE